MNFDEADQVVHQIETQWHYETMVKYGYTPDKTEAKGLVRSWLYTHNDTGHQVRVSTGVSSDHWRDMETDEGGYWAGLEPHLARRAAGG